MEKEKRKKRLLSNIRSIFVLMACICVISLVSIKIVNSYRLNETLKNEKEKITEEIRLLEDQRAHGSYYEVYVKDNFTLYDGEVIIEFNK